MTAKELAEYLKVCKQHGVSSFEMGGVKITLDPFYAASRRSKPKEEPVEAPLSPEDILLWSSSEPVLD